jgi:hypothetical protein
MLMGNGKHDLRFNGAISLEPASGKESRGPLGGPTGRSPEVKEGKVHRCLSAGPVPRDLDQYGSSPVFPRWHEADLPDALL